ncbi:MAG: cupin domain-containing protein [Candidatus Sulfotelmatobacter sp.]
MKAKEIERLRAERSGDEAVHGLIARPPECFRPDRTETISAPGERPPDELVSGVSMDCLVGQHNGARHLATGLVSFAPGAQLPYHTHPVSESVTLLSGSAIVSVEEREYCLGTFDNIVIPEDLPHSVRNASDSESARFHVAFPSASPARDWVTAAFERLPMPHGSTGTRGKERITRFTTASRSEAGPGTSFIDHFNQELMPGLKMSGGYGLFQPGGRLPAHFHDFDESICIIEGTATCVCEGRRHSMSGGTTALQPRGRVHYFINESAEPMSMLWVYAGPSPDRLLVEESCATTTGAAWPE